MRLALVGAFPFPVAQGSQRFAAEQARALQDAGARVTLFAYGRGDGRTLPDLELVRIPRALSPRRRRAGPGAAKPVADAALLARLVVEGRRRRFDAVLAHNAEAALVARAARAVLGTPVVYVAHTLFGEELETYLPRAGRPTWRRLGAALDRAAAGGADAVLALTSHAAGTLAAHARGPLEVIPPGLHPETPPDRERVRATCARAGLAPGDYAVYVGNLDAYQDLPLLDAAAAALPAIPVVAATHDARGPALPHLRVVRVATPEEARAFVHGARVALLPRRRAGGFPMKLLDFMEAALPVVAFAAVADTLESGRSGWLLPAEAGAGALAEALRTLFSDPELAARLGAGARRRLDTAHAWPDLAARTLDLVGRARAGARRAGAGPG